MKNTIQMYIKLENFVTNFLIMAVVFFVFIASVMRWLGNPIAWSVDMAQLLFVWVIFLGANRALREDRHIGVDFVVKKFSAKIRYFVELFVSVLILVFLLFLARYGILLSIENYVRTIGTLPFSYSYITLAVPVGCFIMSVTTINKIWKRVASIRKTV